MKILLDVTSASASSLNTGIQRTVRGLFHALQQRTEVVPLAWVDWLRAYARLTARQQRFLAQPFGESSPATAAPDRASRSFFSTAVSSLSALPRRFPWNSAARDSILMIPEVFRDHRTRFLPGILKQTRIRFIAFAHDVIPLTRTEVTESSRLSGFEGYVKTLALAEKVICVSNQTRADLESIWKRLGIRSVQTEVIAWPVQGFTPFPSTRLDPPQILCVSTLEKRKNHLALLAAAEQLHAKGVRFQLILVGRTTGSWGPRVISEVRRLQKTGVPVDWLKHVNDERLSELYASCRFTVYPSLEEGFGLPIMESLACRRPCVCGSNGALGEVARGGGCLLVDQRQPEALADAMETLLLDEARYSDLVFQAGQRKFGSWSDYAAALLDAINP